MSNSLAPSPVAVDHEAHVDPEAHDDPRPSRHPRSRPLALLVVVALILAGVAGWLGLRLKEQNARAGQGRAAAGVADTVVSLLWTVDAGTSQDVFAELLANSTGSLKSQLSQSSGTFQQVLVTQRVSSRGSLVQTGTTDLQARTASVLVAVNASITDPNGKGSLRQYRMRATLQRPGSRWLVSDLEFVA